MKHFVNFLIAALICTAFVFFVTPSHADKTKPSQQLSYIIDSTDLSSIDTIAQLPVYAVPPAPPAKGAMIAGNPVKVPDLTELIKYLLSTFGGIITTVILAFLRKKFPDWFPESLLKRN